ncbi:hypothetical protein ABEB36_004572 [Hypothenemus hampei]|uniref:DNA-directed DNA polymerase n=1 Tax=Hypothenemus hampei TaxID=57062 RepID=A0ABD1F3R7_HYPHA
MLVHKRFFVALALQDLVNEVPLAEVCMKFNCNRGMLQGLQQSASTFAGMVTSFSKQLGWTSVEILLAQFQDRMQFGVGRDLLDLMQLPVLNGKLARILYKAGVETLVQLANQSVDAIEGILIKAKPFESSKIREGESENEAKKRTSLKTVWISGKDGLTEKDAADLLVKDARSYLVSAMGLKKATWGANRRGVNESSQSPRSKLSFQSKDNDILSKNTSPLDTSNFHDSYGTDESFSLQLSDDLSISDNDFETQNTFVKALERISLTQELASVDQEEHLAEKRNRSNYSDDSLLEATPKKKIKQVTADALNSTINRYTQNQNGTLQFANLCITKVGTLTKTKEEFICDLKNKDIISLGISFLKPQEKLNVNLFGNHTVEQQPKLLMAIYWGDAHAYYFPLTEHFTLLIQDFLKDNCKCIQIFNAKKWLKVLLKSNSEFNCKIEDPKVGDWLLDTDTREKHLKHMFSYYKEKLDEIRAVCNEIDKIKDFWSEKSTVREEVKVSVESILTWHLMDILTKEIREQNPKLTIRPLEGFTCSYELEMKMLLCTVKMEMAGLGVDTLSLQKLVDHLKEQQISIESKAYFLAGRRFNMASSKDVSKVIGTYNGKKISTKRKILEQNEHPISNLVLLWRKLNFTLVNIILPILRVCVNNRINGQYQNHTATGRITMHEPNIQMVPKNFDIVNPITEKNILINCRQVFQASQDCMLVSADYCQLELRILAYLSKDEILMGIMAKPGDIFKSIAAKWHNIPEIVVKDDMRNNVKQICYGIIYGMGINTLAEQMKISTEEAASLVETFRNTYIGIKKFVEKTIQFCKTHHYVETIAGRRRYLPNIVHADPSISGQAERQAVNTTVQGSAADIVKNAMLTIERKNDFVFKKSRFKPKLVLHLHDELIYEVSDKYLEKMLK